MLGATTSNAEDTSEVVVDDEAANEKSAAPAVGSVKINTARLLHDYIMVDPLITSTRTIPALYEAAGQLVFRGSRVAASSAAKVVEEEFDW